MRKPGLTFILNSLGIWNYSFLPYLRINHNNNKNNSFSLRPGIALTSKQGQNKEGKNIPETKLATFWKVQHSACSTEINTRMELIKHSHMWGLFLTAELIAEHCSLYVNGILYTGTCFKPNTDNILLETRIFRLCMLMSSLFLVYLEEVVNQVIKELVAVLVFLCDIMHVVCYSMYAWV